jgi:NTE family protein
VGKGKLRLEEGKKVTPGDLYESFNQAYTSLYFDKISYELQPLEDDLSGEEAGILIQVEEKHGGQLRVGLNYNSVYKASLALNATFRNILVNGSKLSLTANLGENPMISLSYFKNNGWKPGLSIDLLSRDFNVNLFEENSIYANLDYTDFVASITTRSIINNSYSFGFGLEYEHILLDKVYGPPIVPVRSIYDFYNLTGFIDLDTYDHLFYPARGNKLYGTYKLINSTVTAPMHFLSLRFENATSLGRRLVLKPGIQGGFTTADSSFSVCHFYLGGLNNAPRKGLMPFTGLDFMQKTDRNVAVLKLDAQYNG